MEAYSDNQGKRGWVQKVKKVPMFFWAILTGLFGALLFLLRGPKKKSKGTLNMEQLKRSKERIDATRNVQLTQIRTDADEIRSRVRHKFRRGAMH